MTVVSVAEPAQIQGFRSAFAKLGEMRLHYWIGAPPPAGAGDIALNIAETGGYLTTSGRSSRR